MAPGLQARDRRFPPNSPIPGRGLPPDVYARIPTVQFRLVRAGGLFATSVAASATLAIGPALVIVKLGAGVPGIVVPGITLRHAAPADRLAAGAGAPRLQLRRERPAVRSRAPVVVAGTGGAPRGGSRSLGVPGRGAGGPGRGSSILFAGGREQWRSCPGEYCTLSRRPRPPPASANRKPHRSVALIELAPATPPPYWWCGPGFLFSRV